MISFLKRQEKSLSFSPVTKIDFVETAAWWWIMILVVSLNAVLGPCFWERNGLQPNQSDALVKKTPHKLYLSSIGPWIWVSFCS